MDCAHLSLLLPLIVLLLGLLGPLLVDDGLLSLCELGALLLSKRESVVTLIPLSEGGGIDHHNGVLHKGLGTDQLVVASVVDNVDDTGAASDGL